MVFLRINLVAALPAHFRNFVLSTSTKVIVCTSQSGSTVHYQIPGQFDRQLTWAVVCSNFGRLGGGQVDGKKCPPSVKVPNIEDVDVTN